MADPPQQQQQKQAYQPLHPSIRTKLDPEYVKIHDQIVQYLKPIELISPTLDQSLRSQPSPLAGYMQKTVEVGRVYDRDVDHYRIRVFVPPGRVPGGDKGWPCLVWYHGGGWALGGLDSENGFLTHLCKYLQCLVVSVDYRLAPENPYPAATDDALDGFKWVVTAENAKELGIDTTRVAIGGVSAGGALAAITSLRLADESASNSNATDIPKPLFQLLICPVIDNMATVETTWATSQHSPFLTPAKMLWYRKLYFQGNTPEADQHHWHASPCYAPPSLLAQSPDTLIAIADCDLLAPEAAQYAASLRQNGVKVETKEYKGAIHILLSLAGAHDIAKDLVHDACEALARALGLKYSWEEAPIFRHGE